MEFRTGFPAGNAILDEISGNRIRFRPDLRDTSEPWFYWAFGLSGAAGQRLQFEISRPWTLSTRGPAMSLDGGLSWNWLGAESLEGEWGFHVDVPPDCAEIRLSVGMPYTGFDLDRALQPHRQNPRLRVQTLCESRGGRPVEMFTIPAGGDRVSGHLIVTARHHACEMMASYVLEGWLLDLVENSKAAKFETHFVPFVDRDGVENGDQGKLRIPHDHNRDYLEPSIYPETAAIRQWILSRCGGQPFAIIDLHCPWIRGKHNDCLYIVGSRREANAEAQRRLGHLIESHNDGPLPFAMEDYLPFGEAWNTGKNEAHLLSFSRWAECQPDNVLSASVEIPYDSARGEEVNRTSATAFGRILGRAIGTFLAEF